MIKKNTSLLNDIIASDFLINTLNNKNYSKYNNTFIKLESYNFFILDLLEVNKTLKQFIRLLQNLNKNENNTLYLLFENNYYTILINKLISLENKLKNNIKFYNSTHYLPHLSQNYSDLLMLFGQPYTISNNQIIKRFFNNKIFLINKINANFENFNFNNYKIVTNLDDIKKILFIYIIIKKILKKL